MPTQPPGDQPRDLKRPDEIDQLFGLGNPNPDRVGCLPRDVAIALARRELPLSDPGYKHLTACSPCYLEVRAIQEADQEHRRGRVIRMITRGIAAAAVLVLVIAAWFFLLDRRATEVSVELDLRPYALTRGEPAGKDPQPLALPRARLGLTLLLPAGFEAGAYDIQILDPDSKRQTSSAGIASVENYVTILRSELDLHSLPAGSYGLALRRDKGEKQLFVVRLQ